MGSKRNIGVPCYPQLLHPLCFQPQHRGGPGCPYLRVPGGPHIHRQRRQPSVCRKGGRFQSGLWAGVQAAKPRRRLLEVMGKLGTKGGAQPRGSSSAAFISQLSRTSSGARPAHFTHLCPRIAGTTGLPICLYDLQSAHLKGFFICWGFYLLVTLNIID